MPSAGVTKAVKLAVAAAVSYMLNAVLVQIANDIDKMYEEINQERLKRD